MHLEACDRQQAVSRLLVAVSSQAAKASEHQLAMGMRDFMAVPVQGTSCVPCPPSCPFERPDLPPAEIGGRSVRQGLLRGATQKTERLLAAATAASIFEFGAQCAHDELRLVAHAGITMKPADQAKHEVMSATMAVSRDQSDVRSNAPQLPEFQGEEVSHHAALSICALGITRRSSAADSSGEACCGA